MCKNGDDIQARRRNKGMKVYKEIMMMKQKLLTINYQKKSGVIRMEQNVSKT